jgi:O-antigen biosynthesis protein
MTERLMAPVQLLDLEWSEGTRAIDVDPGHTAVRALVRVHGVPVGWATLPVTDGRCTSRRVEAAVVKQCGHAIVTHLVADALAAPGGWCEDGLLHAPHPVWTGPFPLVTVAVCTHDRTHHLERCLESWSRLDYPRLDRLVVDNAPTSDATEALVRRHPEVRYVREPRPGLDRARNRAIAEARGDLIAFTDDDATVDPGWVRALAEDFADPDVMAVTGLVVPAELETDAQVLFEEYGGFGRGFERRFYRVHGEAGERTARFHGGAGMFGTGANMAYRRELFDRIGPFDPALDVGTATNGGGDLEMFFRTLKEGHTLVYEPAALVRHWHRRDYADLRTQIRNNGVGFHAYLVRAGLAYPDERLTILRLAQWWMRWWHVRRLLRSLVRPHEFPRDLIRAELSGVVPGLFAYFRARREGVPLGGAPLALVAAPAPRTRRQRKAGPALRLVDVGEPLRHVEDAGHARSRVLVTRGHHALADVELPMRGRALSPARLRDAVARDVAKRFARARAHPRATARLLDAHVADRRDRLAPDVTVSIVVATRNRPDDLRVCLRHLAAQESPRPVEIVVVDNDPGSGATAPVVAAFPAVRLVEEPRQGLAYARNAGFAASRGELLVATDDDVTMPPGWLEELLAPFARPKVAAVTGLVWPESLDEPAQRLFESYGGLARGLRPFVADSEWFRSFRIRAVPTWDLGATANAAFRASVLDEVGMMDEALGAGTPTGCSEDTDLFYRILRNGHILRYEPRAYVRHRHRRTRPALRRQIYAYSKGHVAYHLTTLLRDRDHRAAVRLLLELPYGHLLRAWRSVRGHSDYPLSLLLVEIAGHVAGPWSLWRSRRRVRRLSRTDDGRERSRIAEHDLLDPAPVEGLRRYGRARVLLRAGRQPLGLLDLGLRSGESAISTARIEEAAVSQLGLRPADVRASCPPDVAGPLPPISVVVCTRDRPELLAECLAALQRLRYPSFEVIVVDSASRDEATARVVEGTPARYVREARPGLNWARRRGAAEARHDIVAYVDDDVRVDPWWLHGMSDAFSDPSVAVATGLVLPAELETRAQHLFERYGGMGKGFRARSFRAAGMTAGARLAVHALGVGANMALRRAALERLGGFDTRLDLGTPARGGGDLEMFSRALAAGLTVRYEPRALAWHRHRRDLEALRRQIHDNGVAFGVHLIHAWREGRTSALAAAHFGLWKWFGGYLLVRLARGLVGREPLPLSLLWAETRGALEAPFAYVAAQRHDRRVRRGARAEAATPEPNRAAT